MLNPLVRVAMPRMVKKLKIWDFAAAQRPDFLLANSNEVKSRIKKFYNREAEVINPPVNVDRFKSKSSNKPKYFLVVSRLVPYKRVDLAVKACTKLNIRLIVAGKGPEFKKLNKIAGKSVEFVQNPTDHRISQLYSGAKGFIFSAEEDFGITPVEAMASGLPVICYGKGGATETVIDGQTGIYHNSQTVESLIEAIKKFEVTKFSSRRITDRAAEFSEKKFLNKVGGYIVGKIKTK
jgi:glycosyltransferase involved in cell wall biosynthesis